MTASRAADVLQRDVPSMAVLPVDASIDVAITGSTFAEKAVGRR